MPAAFMIRAGTLQRSNAEVGGFAAKFTKEIDQTMNFVGALLDRFAGGDLGKNHSICCVSSRYYMGKLAANGSYHSRQLTLRRFRAFTCIHNFCSTSFLLLKLAMN